MLIYTLLPGKLLPARQNQKNNRPECPIRSVESLVLPGECFPGALSRSCLDEVLHRYLLHCTLSVWHFSVIPTQEESSGEAEEINLSEDSSFVGMTENSLYIDIYRLSGLAC
ncbi:hypothetical protein GCM10028809_05030 [Spirosoma gilvum]